MTGVGRSQMIISQAKLNTAFAKFMGKIWMQFGFSALKKLIVSQLRGTGTHWKMVAYEDHYSKIGRIAGRPHQESGNRMRHGHGHDCPDDDAIRSYPRNAQIWHKMLHRKALGIVNHEVSSLLIRCNRTLNKEWWEWRQRKYPVPVNLDS